MLIECFLIQLFKQDGARGAFFWLTAGIYFVLIAAGIAGKWILFRKTGRTPWHSLVPVWNEYELYDICWDGRYGIVSGLLYIFILFLLPSPGVKPLLVWYWPLLFTAFFVVLVLSGIMKLKLSRSFGRSSIFTYGLLCAEGIFYLILACSDSEYLGRTLRKFNPESMQAEKTMNRGKSKRQYMIALHRSRSIVALAACVSTFALCLFAVAGGLIEDPSEITPERGNQLYKLFTVYSNIFSAVGAALMIPYAVEGIRKKRFSYPKWLQLLQYSGAICTTITMVFAIFLIFPTKGPAIAFGRMNFWLHIICPVMTLILLFSVETDLDLSATDALLCLVPFYIYATIYLIMVVLIGEADGGWRDIYMLTQYIPPTISMPLMYMLGLGIALGIRSVYNRISNARQKEMKQLWTDDLSSIEIKIEAYGLGRHTGFHEEITNITVPFDIFYDLAGRYDVTVEELANAFNKGLLGGLAERNVSVAKRRAYFAELIGTPEHLRERDDIYDGNQIH